MKAKCLVLHQWSQKVVPRILHHLYLCMPMYQRAIPPCSILGASYSWCFHLHPLFRLRVVVGILRQLPDDPVLRPLDHLWSCDDC